VAVVEAVAEVAAAVIVVVRYRVVVATPVRRVGEAGSPVLRVAAERVSEAVAEHRVAVVVAGRIEADAVAVVAEAAESAEAVAVVVAAVVVVTNPIERTNEHEPETIPTLTAHPTTNTNLGSVLIQGP